jgi:RNA polymerase sigma-54 factor
MALAPRLDLRQSQSLVMTPQLQQAIKLLALSSLEIEAFIAEEVERNPVLETGSSDAAPDVPTEDFAPALNDSRETPHRTAWAGPMACLALRAAPRPMALTPTDLILTALPRTTSACVNI